MSANKSSILKTKHEYLKKVPLFSGLNDEQLKRMTAVMTVSEFEAGSYVMREGDSSTEIYILLKGEVEISKSLVLPQWIQSAQKQEKALIRLSEKHHPFFGEMSMFGKDSTRDASILAVKNCQMACLQKEALLKETTRDPEAGTIIYRNIATELAQRLRKANKDILKLTTAFSLALEG